MLIENDLDRIKSMNGFDSQPRISPATANFLMEMEGPVSTRNFEPLGMAAAAVQTLQNIFFFFFFSVGGYPGPPD